MPPNIKNIEGVSELNLALVSTPNHQSSEGATNFCLVSDQRNVPQTKKPDMQRLLLYVSNTEYFMR